MERVLIHVRALSARAQDARPPVPWRHTAEGANMDKIWNANEATNKPRGAQFYRPASNDQRGTAIGIARTRFRTSTRHHGRPPKVQVPGCKNAQVTWPKTDEQRSHNAREISKSEQVESREATRTQDRGRGVGRAVWNLQRLMAASDRARARFTPRFQWHL